jgi:uncharacterized protein YecE (DUF72 family)
MGWSYGFWRGNFYANNLAASEFLRAYSMHFNSVEVDSTFYRTPSNNTTVKWKDQTPSDFLFSLKLPRVITHEKSLINCEREFERFVTVASALREKLGPLLIQLPPTFKPEHTNVLSDFLSNLPKTQRFAIEMRNRNLLAETLFSLLKEHQVALVIADTHSMPRTEAITADFTYIRWEGDRTNVKGTQGKMEVDRTNDIRGWAKKIQTILNMPVEVFGYFSKYYSGHPPTDIEQLLKFLETSPAS